MTGRTQYTLLISLAFMPFLLLAGCEKKEDEIAAKCQEVTIKVQTAAKCIVNPIDEAAADVDIETLGYDPTNCASYDKIYRSLGLTNNDARQVAQGVNKFYETYKQMTFCAYLKPRMNQLGL